MTNRTSQSAGFSVDAALLALATRRMITIELTNDCEKNAKGSSLQSLLLTCSLKLPPPTVYFVSLLSDKLSYLELVFVLLINLSIFSTNATQE